MEQEKKKRRKPLWIGVLGVLAAGAVITTTNGLQREGVKVQQYTELASKAYCTVLVYMDGSGLESDYGAAAEDLKEMEQAVHDAEMDGETLRVVVEAGGASQWQYETMQDKKYAAEHYGLVLWNHGAGQIEGFGRDNNFEAASLPLESIKDAMEASVMKTPFDFISLDACLMGNLELVSLLRDRADYLIASEELEPQNGYDYDWLRAIGKEFVRESSRGGDVILLRSI